jgi:hypothetical protein
MYKHVLDIQHDACEPNGHAFKNKPFSLKKNYIYFRMFRANTDSKCIFKKFKELTSDDELRVSDTLEQHATGVMNVIDDTIMNIENVDYVFELLNATGRKHSTYEGFSQIIAYF